MSFFNNKNQVLKFELTPYGRYLMSQGKLDPYCYEFIDDDVHDFGAFGLGIVCDVAIQRTSCEQRDVVGFEEFRCHAHVLQREFRRFVAGVQRDANR